MTFLQGIKFRQLEYNHKCHGRISKPALFCSHRARRQPDLPSDPGLLDRGSLAVGVCALALERVPPGAADDVWISDAAGCTDRTVSR